MSSVRNHAKRSHRSHHDVRANTSYNTRRTAIRELSEPRRQSTFFKRLMSKLFRRHKFNKEDRA